MIFLKNNDIDYKNYIDDIFDINLKENTFMDLTENQV